MMGRRGDRVSKEQLYLLSLELSSDKDCPLGLAVYQILDVWN